PMQAIHGVSDRAADDQAKRQRRQTGRHAGEPDPQENDGHDLEGQQRPGADRPGLREQPVADPGVPGQDQRDEGADRDGAVLQGRQEPELCRLIGHAGDNRDKKAEAAERSPDVGARGLALGSAGNVHVPYSAALRVASHSRSAWASRGVTSGNCGSSPTASEIFHDRAHFRPSASRGSTATPRTSSSRNASGGPSPSTKVAAEVMHSSARSASTAAANRSASAT